MQKSRIQIIKELVDTLYLSHHPDRDSWADYLFGHHIYLVADQSVLLARRFGGSEDIVYAGALLHDIADATMSRFDVRHETECLGIAQDFLTRAGFSEDEMIIVHDILVHHSCRDILPQTQEGRIIATADALVHLTSDFYEHALVVKTQEGESRENINNWALPKIERDFYTKIFFDEIRQENQTAYERVKSLFH
ncbi:HD domain-containing protein [Candidatus Gracilibacteria bacterium]|nr:HD domain-containing protein [Candidatus Gracilibacteria bacterium]